MISVPITSKINTPFGDILVHSVGSMSMENTIYMVSGDSVVKLENVGTENNSVSRFSFENRIAALELDKPRGVSISKHTTIEEYSRWIA
jgi:hypothetical protein